MQLTHVERDLLEDQILRDTLWCLRCGMGGKRQEAHCQYTVEGLSHLVLACRDCLKAALAEGMKVSSSEPVRQPAYVALLRRLMIQNGPLAQ